MSKNDSIKKINKFITDKIRCDNFENLMSDRFGRYSKYIIQERALPDARDGLKPVQRRILFAMYKLGLTSNKSYKKSARIVGDVIGKYHPHGDTAVYDAMVRMSQDFKILLPLIDMHGNNGSIDGDPAAAMRYTEARMSKYAELLLEDLQKRTVGFVPNFDDEELEPVVLPAKFPNLLVNGANGIASGYATDIPPHNPKEVIEAVIYRMQNHKCGLEELLEIVKGPDFPTGGIVQGIDGLISAYKTGRGKVILKSKCEIDRSKVEPKIVITEIPYEINKAVLLKKMSDQITAKNVDGVKAIRDETDRTGLRIVIDVRRDANPEFILNFLLKSTDLQVNYNFNMVAIADGRPLTMGLIDILDAYIAHQRDVMRNKCNFDLDRAEKRLEVVNGLIAMVSILDSVITTIRNSKNKSDAKENIISKYQFTELQAEAIVMLQLYKLTNTDIVALQQESKELDAKIRLYQKILSSDTALNNAVIDELKRTMSLLDIERKTIIEHEINEVEVKTEDIITKEDVMLLISHDGYLKRLSMRSFANLAEGEQTKLKDGDVLTDIYRVTTVDVLLQFTNLGKYVFLPIHKIPESKHKDLGFHVSTLITMEVNEKIIYSYPVSSFEADKYILLATKSGLIKRMKLNSLNVNRYSKALKATKLKDGDEVCSVDIITGSSSEVVVATKDGYMNRYNAKEISIMEPSSFGVKAIELKNRPNDEVVGAKYVAEKDIILLLTNRGNVKRMRPDEILKGKKNHVGKMYLKVVKSNMHEAINMDVIHAANTKSSLALWIYGQNGHVDIDYTILRIAIADNGKKMCNAEELKPDRLVISRNDFDVL